MKSKFKKFLSLALAIVMVFGMLPMAAFAAEGDEPAEEASDVILDINFDNVVTNEDGTVTVNSEVGELALTVGNNITVADGVATFADGNNGIYANNVDNATDPMKALSGAASTTNMWIKPDGDIFANTIFAYGHVQANGDLGASMELMAIANSSYDAIVYYRNASGSTNNDNGGKDKIQGQDTSKYVAGQWQLLSLVEDNGTVTVYVNGVRIAQNANITRSMYGWANDELADNYYIGAKHATGTQSPFVGQVDSLTVLNKAMTAEELFAMYEERFYGDGVVLDSAWEVEQENENLTVNDDGTVTILTEPGTIGDANGIKNAMYYELPVTNDYVFTVKVNGEFTQNYHGAYLMIATGMNLENAVGVVRRYHGYLGGNYGTNELFGVMQDGTPAEYYEGNTEMGNEFYLKLQKQGSKITGYYAKEYSDDPADWNQIIDGTNEFVTKDALGGPEKLYLVLGACSGGGNVPNAVTFSDLKVDGEAVSITTDPRAMKEITLTGETEMVVGKPNKLELKAVDYAGLQTTPDSVTYTSSDETVATVSETGSITGLTDGFVTITATATKDGVTKTAEITIQVGEIKVDGAWTVTSPDGKTTITVELITGGTLQYRVTQGDVTTIYNSPMGMVTNLGDFSKNLVLKEATEVKEVNESYEMLSGKDDVYTDHCNEQTITFTRKDNEAVEFDVVIRAYNDGAAYRYGIRGEEGAALTISDETSGLQMPGGATVYWLNYSSASWNYESQYATTTTEGLAVGSTPSMPFMYGTDGVWTLFTESNLHGSFTGSMLTMGEGGLLDVSFAKKQTSAVKTTAPFESPWRVAIIGDLEAIVENTLVENLADAPDMEKYKFDEWVYPGLSSWSWVANWGQGIADQTKAETHLNWIEFGAEIGWDFYILDEGWAAQGRGNVQPNENGMREWWPEVKAAAEEAGVKLWAWVHVSDIRDNAKREALFEYWASEGIVGIKPDFFDGEDQATIQLYDDLYEDAAAAGLMVLVHGANKPTGEVRTWPNVYGREAIRGQEAGGITAEQYTIIPYIRAAVGPAEVTEELKSKDYNKTTMGFQIALTVLVEDGIHSMGSQPSVYRENPEGMIYYTNYPRSWDQTEFVSGDIGSYVNIARLAKGSNDWYLSGISVDPRTQDVSLSFLDAEKTYTALLFKENDRRDLVMDVIPELTSKDSITVSNLYGGGYAVRLIPSEDVSSITEITAPASVSVEEYASVPAEITVAPTDVEFTTVVWSSADESIATVNANGVISGKKAGETVVTVASAMDPEVKAEIKVTVTESPFDFIKIEAETGTVEGGAEIENKAAASGGKVAGWLGRNNGAGKVTLTVPNVAEDCTTTMFVTHLLDGSREFAISVNGGEPIIITPPSTGSWDIPATEPFAVTINLKAGDNTITFGGNGKDAPSVDYILVGVPKSSDIPAPEPIQLMLPEDTITLDAGETKTYTARVNGEMIMTVEGDVTVAYNGETYTAENGSVSLTVSGSMFAPQPEFVITNNAAAQGSYKVTFAYPEGSMENPAALNIGVNSADVAAGSMGYFYTWTAEEDGHLTIAVDTELTSNWTYVINNMTSYAYGDNHASTDENVVASETIDVKAGDEIQVVVGTADWAEGRVVLNASFSKCHIKDFSDTNDLTAKWYHGALDYVVGANIMVGSDNKLMPEENISRAEIVQLIYTMAGKPGYSADTPSRFPDVTPSDWYYDAVMWATENNIAYGYGNGTFGPNDEINREQLVSFFHRYAGSPEAESTKLGFADASDVSVWSLPAVLWASETGIVSGRDNNMFAPFGTSMRAEAAQIIMKYCELFVAE